jgi:hypothetical protein
MRIAVAGLVFTVISCIAAILMIPEVRDFLGLDKQVPGPSGSTAPVEKLVDEPSGSTELVDVGFTTEGAFEALDFKVTNSTDDPIFIKRADLRVKKILKKIWYLIPPYHENNNCLHEYMPSSHTYDIKLPSDGAPYTVSKDLSQSINPNKNDRFKIAVKPDPRESQWVQGYDYVFLISVSLVYGEGNNILARKDVLLADSGNGLGAYRPGPCVSAGVDAESLKKQNARTMAKIERIEVPRNKLLHWISQDIR